MKKPQRLCGRCQLWELTQWIRDESEGVHTPTLRELYDYMIPNLESKTEDDSLSPMHNDIQMQEKSASDGSQQRDQMNVDETKNKSRSKSNRIVHKKGSDIKRKHKIRNEGSFWDDEESNAKHKKHQK
eukprot:425022_1